MSNVTDVVLTTSFELEAVQELQAWLESNNQAKLNEVSERTLGGKVMCTEVWIGAYNYLDCEGFKEAFLAAKWDYPESVRLIIYEEERDEPVIVRPQL